jgi:hypothetical protein
LVPPYWGFTRRASATSPTGRPAGRPSGPAGARTERLPAYERAAAESYVRRHPDRTSYLLLDELREYFPDAYARLPLDTRAAVLCDALKHHKCCNDWGILSTHDWANHEAARALVETGRAALPHLRPLLDDRSDFHYERFKAYSTSTAEHYRRCDFAHRYACQIMAVRPEYDPDPAVRDKAIEQLKRSLDAAADK